MHCWRVTFRFLTLAGTGPSHTCSSRGGTGKREDLVEAVSLEKQQGPCWDRGHWHRAGELWSVWYRLAGVGAGSNFGWGQWWPSVFSTRGQGQWGVATKAMRPSRKWHLRLQQVNCDDCQGEAQEPFGDPASQKGRTRAWDSTDLLPQTQGQWLLLQLPQNSSSGPSSAGRSRRTQATPIP